MYGVIRASTYALGVSTLLEDFGSVGIKVSVGMDATAAIGIVQRRGLNKLRHVEVDVLWIQEQQVRRLLPLRKVPGPRNPSEMMTKNVDQAHIDMYLDIRNLRSDMGRADIAQNLHSMGRIEQSKYTSALLSVDLMPLRPCGNTVESAKPITPDTGIPTRTLRTVFANCPESPI